MVTSLSRRLEVSAFTGDDPLHRATIAATAVLLVAAIYGNSRTGFGFHGVQLTYFRLYFPLYALLLAAYLLTHRDALTPIPWPVAALLGFGGYVTVSAAWATDTGMAISGLARILPGLLIAGAIYWTTKRKQTVLLYLAVLVGLVACAEVVSVWEIVTGSHLSDVRLLQPHSQVFWANHPSLFGSRSSSAWFYNINGYAFFLVIGATPLVAVIAARDTRRSLRALAALGWLTAFLFVLNDRARAGVGALLVGAVAIIALRAVRPRLAARTPSRVDAWVVTVVIALGTLTTVALPALVPALFPPGSGLGGRWQLAQVAAEALVQSNGLGTGVRNFAVAVRSSSIETAGSYAPHSWMIALVGSFGVVGTGLFVLAYGRLIYDVGAQFVTTADPLSLGLFGSMVAFSLAALAPSNVLYSSLVLYALFGLTAATVYKVPASSGR